MKSKSLSQVQHQWTKKKWRTETEKEHQPNFVSQHRRAMVINCWTLLHLTSLQIDRNRNNNSGNSSGGNSSTSTRHTWPWVHFNKCLMESNVPHIWISVYPISISRKERYRAPPAAAAAVTEEERNSLVLFGHKMCVALVPFYILLLPKTKLNYFNRIDFSFFLFFQLCDVVYTRSRFSILKILISTLAIKKKMVIKCRNIFISFPFFVS